MKIPTIVREIQYQNLTKKNIKNKPNKKKPRENHKKKYKIKIFHQQKNQKSVKKPSLVLMFGLC